MVCESLLTTNIQIYNLEVSKLSCYSDCIVLTRATRLCGSMRVSDCFVSLDSTRTHAPHVHARAASLAPAAERERERKFAFAGSGRFLELPSSSRVSQKPRRIMQSYLPFHSDLWLLALCTVLLSLLLLLITLSLFSPQWSLSASLGHRHFVNVIVPRNKSSFFYDIIKHFISFWIMGHFTFFFFGLGVRETTRLALQKNGV